MERNKFTPEQEKWLQALESGEWKQGRGSLRTRYGNHCCLGVANIVCSLGEQDNVMLFHSYGRLHLRSQTGHLARGIDAGKWRELTAMNDGGWTFKRIATFIRANPWQVFTNFDAPEGH